MFVLGGFCILLGLSEELVGQVPGGYAATRQNSMDVQHQPPARHDIARIGAGGQRSLKLK